MPFYAVTCGREMGVFDDWFLAKKMVTGHRRGFHRKFATLKEAERFLQEYSDFYDEVGEPQTDYSSLDPQTGRIVVKTEYSINIVEGSNSWPPVRDHAIDYHESLVDTVEKISVQSAIRTLVLQEVYVDGGARGNGSQSAKGGYGVYFKSGSMPSAVPFADCTCNAECPTNQLMEILAVRDALSQIYDCVRESECQMDIYTIYSDSQYAINCVTLWYKKWENNGWKNAVGGPVANAGEIYQCIELIRAINSAYSTFSKELVFVHVNGHSGNTGNELADLLANKAMDEDENRRFY